jgi:hypothetical protein
MKDSCYKFQEWVEIELLWTHTWEAENEKYKRKALCETWDDGIKRHETGKIGLLEIEWTCGGRPGGFVQFPNTCLYTCGPRWRVFLENLTVLQMVKICVCVYVAVFVKRSGAADPLPKIISYTFIG